MNCIIVDDDSTSRKIIEDFVKKVEILNLIGVCKNAIEASNILNKEEANLLLLDIEMPEMSGLELIESLKGDVQVILITSKENYAVNAFDLNVTDYLVKPMTFNRFLKAINKAYDAYAAKVGSKAEHLFFVKSGSSYLKLNVEDIVYIESLGDYVSIHTAEKRHIVNITMKETEEKLKAHNFCRIHRSYIVNLNRVEEIENNTIAIAGKVLPVSRSHKKDLLDKLKIF